nr:SAM-dependent methyltransferase [uncultured Rhodopila sp.]
MSWVGHPARPAAADLLGDQRPLAVRGNALVLSARGATAQVARAVAYAVTAAWWRTLVEQAGGNPDSLVAARVDGIHLDLPVDVLAEAEVLALDLATRLPVAEGSAELGRIYAHALPGDQRAADGIFYTPLPLVRRLLDQAGNAGHDWLTGSAIDPSCGGGAFLVEAAARMLANMPGADPAIVVAAVGARLRGWDIDPFACWLAQVAVEAALLRQVVASRKRLPQITECRNALCNFGGDTGRYGLVMGNPAFGKVKKTEEMGRTFARSLYGHPNLYGMLTDLAVHLAKADGGVVAYLTPTSYLGGEYFKLLRKLLVEQAKPITVDIVESRTDVFADVLQEVALTCFKRGRKAQKAGCFGIRVDPGGLKITETGYLTLPRNALEPWIVPRVPDDAALVEKLSTMPTRIRDWGYQISTGPLVWNRHKEQLHAQWAEDRCPVIWAEAVTPDGRFSLQALKSNHRDRVWFAPRGPKDPNLVRKGCVLAQRTTAKEQDRRIICAVMPQEVVTKFKAVAVENHLNMFVPTSVRPGVSLSALAAFLSTRAADRVIRCINGSVALSASELEAMPLPSVDDLRTALGASDLESAVCRLYGIANDPAADTSD